MQQMFFTNRRPYSFPITSVRLSSAIDYTRWRCHLHPHPEEYSGDNKQEFQEGKSGSFYL